MEKFKLRRPLAMLAALCLLLTSAFFGPARASEEAVIPTHKVSFFLPDGRQLVAVQVENDISLVEANAKNPAAFFPLKALAPESPEGFVFRHWCLNSEAGLAYRLDQAVTAPLRLVALFKAIEEPVAEEPAAEEPVAEEPVAEEPAAEEPAAEEPAAEEPAAEEPAAEEPAVEEPAAEEPAAEEPAVEEPAAEEPASEEPAVEEPAAEEPAAEEPAVEEPAVEEPAAEEPAVEEPAAEEPAAEEPPVEEPAAEEPAVEEPAVEEPVAEEPVAEEPAAEEPAVEEPAVEEPVVEEPVVEEPAVEEPVAEEPAVEEPAAEEPAAEEPAVEEPETPGRVDEDEEVEIFVKPQEPKAAAAVKPANPPVTTAPAAPAGQPDASDESEEINPIDLLPPDAELIQEILDALNPGRRILIYISWGDQKPIFGSTAKLIAVPEGYDEVEYTLQWQRSTNDVDWVDIPEATGYVYDLLVTPENYLDYLRVAVIIAGVKAN